MNKFFLNEGKRDDALAVFIPLFQKRGIEINVSQLKQFLLNKFVTEAGIHNLSLSSNYYLLGVARYYFSGELTNNSRLNALYPNFKDKFNSELCNRLDIVIGALRDSYIDSVGTKFEQPEDFGNLPLNTLLKKYNKIINKTLNPSTKEKKEKTTPKVSKNFSSGKNYTYEILYSYNDATKYKSYTEPGAWCITYGKQHYDAYVKRLGIHYVIFKKNGFENIPRKKGKNWTSQKPQDEYGNSLIAVLQSNKTGEPIYITSRWNHGSSMDNSRCEADHAYTKEEFFKVTGCNDNVLKRAFEQWKATADSKKERVNRSELYANKMDVLRRFKYAQMMINGGGNVKDYIMGGSIIKDAKGYKGTYIVFLRKDNDVYYTLMDRKKIYFDVFISKNKPSINIYENFVVINDIEKRDYFIFDLRRHNFLTIEDCYKFKDMCHELFYWGDDNIKYTLVAQSNNQIALLNLQTMKTVKSKRGASWFESITSVDAYHTNVGRRGGISLPYRVDKSSILCMVYDSSSGEEYLFDPQKDEFLDTSNIPDGFRPSDVKGDYIVCYYHNPRLKCLLNKTDYTLFQVGGYTKFKSIDVDKNGILCYQGHDEDVAHYVDTKINKVLELNGAPIETPIGGLNIYLSTPWTVIAYREEGVTRYIYDHCLLYNPISRTFFHDNISGYYFNIYSLHGNCIAQKNGEKYSLPSPKDAALAESNKKEEITNNFKDMVNRMGNN